MPWRALQPPDPTGPAKGPVARLSVCTGRNGIPKLLLTLNARLQEQLFGGPVVGKRFRVELGQGPDSGQLRLTPDEKGGFQAVKQPHGTARITLNPWAAHLRSPQKSTRLECHWNGQGLDLVLPDWAGDKGAKAAMDAEFGLKRPT